MNFLRLRLPRLEMPRLAPGVASAESIENHGGEWHSAVLADGIPNVKT